LEETRNPTAWDNQLKGCVTERRLRRHRKWNRKLTAKQLITYFLYKLQAPLDLSSDKDAHLDRSTIIFAIGLLQFWKPKFTHKTHPNPPRTRNATNTERRRKEETQRRTQAKGEKTNATRQTKRS
jgi:hypothetical protein